MASSTKFGKGISRERLYDELALKISDDYEVRRDTKAFAEEVEDYWKRIAPGSGAAGHPYATGMYQESIHRLSMRGRGPRGRFLYHHWVGTFDPIAGFLEYGTGPDQKYPSFGNWIDTEGERQWGWNTPTPEFNFAARTALKFGGTAP